MRKFHRKATTLALKLQSLALPQNNGFGTKGRTKRRAHKTPPKRPRKKTEASRTIPLSGARTVGAYSVTPRIRRDLWEDGDDTIPLTSGGRIKKRMLRQQRISKTGAQDLNLLDEFI